jgi:hypothetical protein
MQPGGPEVYSGFFVACYSVYNRGFPKSNRCELRRLSSLIGEFALQPFLNQLRLKGISGENDE